MKLYNRVATSSRLVLFLLLKLLLVAQHGGVFSKIHEDGACPIVSLLPFTCRYRVPSDIPLDFPEQYNPYSPLRVTPLSYSYAAAILLAVDHFNDRNPVVVPELANVRNCSIYFPEPVFLDSGGDADTAVEALYKAMSLREFRHFCAAIGPLSEEATRSLLPIMKALDIPLIVHAVEADHLLARSVDASASVTLTARGRAMAMVEYLKERDVLGVWNEAGLDQEERLAEAVEQIGNSGLALQSFLYEQNGEEGEESLREKLEKIKMSGITTVFVALRRPHELPALADLLLDLGMLDAEFLYILSPFVIPADRGALKTLYGEHRPGSPLDKLLSGALVFDRVDGFDFRDGDPFLRVWNDQPESEVQRLNGLMPRTWLRADPDFFKVTEPRKGTSFVYDAVIALGLGACKKQEIEAGILDDERLYDDSAPPDFVPLDGLIMVNEQHEEMGMNGSISDKAPSSEQTLTPAAACSSETIGELGDGVTQVQNEKCGKLSQDQVNDTSIDSPTLTGSGPTRAAQRTALPTQTPLDKSQTVPSFDTAQSVLTESLGSTSKPLNLPKTSTTVAGSAAPHGNGSAPSSSVQNSDPSVEASMAPIAAHSKIQSVAGSAAPHGNGPAPPSAVKSSIPSVEAGMAPSAAHSNIPPVAGSVASSMDDSAPPSVVQSSVPSNEAGMAPSAAHSNIPPVAGSVASSMDDSAPPHAVQSSVPSNEAGMAPSAAHSNIPPVAGSVASSMDDSAPPSVVQSSVPSDEASMAPIAAHSSIPSVVGSAASSMDDSAPPSVIQSSVPSNEASMAPIAAHSSIPSVVGSAAPSMDDSAPPSAIQSSVPSNEASMAPSAAHSTFPSLVGSAAPSMDDSAPPSVVQSSVPSVKASMAPSAAHSSISSVAGSVAPSMDDSDPPSVVQSSVPSNEASMAPGAAHSTFPPLVGSATPSMDDSAPPHAVQSSVPSNEASMAPIAAHSSIPSVVGSAAPSMDDSAPPSAVQSPVPSNEASMAPSAAHSTFPSLVGSAAPSMDDSAPPSVVQNSVPSIKASMAPSAAHSSIPSVAGSVAPSMDDSAPPSVVQSSVPYNEASMAPSAAHSSIPSVAGSVAPSMDDSTPPSVVQSSVPSNEASMVPSEGPSSEASAVPSSAPTAVHSMIPSSDLSSVPSSSPTILHSEAPSVEPSESPSLEPGSVPSSFPSVVHSKVPSSEPSQTPSSVLSSVPSGSPTVQHFEAPSVKPSGSPPSKLSSVPSSAPTDTSVQAVLTGFMLVSATLPYQDIMEIKDGDVIDLSTLSSISLSIRSIVDPSSAADVDKVKFVLGNGQIKWEINAPYTLAGNSNGNYNPSSYVSEVGEKSVIQTAITSSGQETSAISFSVINSQAPSSAPSSVPSVLHSEAPSVEPSESFSSEPSSVHSRAPSVMHSMVPSSEPSQVPSSMLSSVPSWSPTEQHSEAPSVEPSESLSSEPSSVPSSAPTMGHSMAPSSEPSQVPSSMLSSVPSGSPTVQHSEAPSVEPSESLSSEPSSVPSSDPTMVHSMAPSSEPSQAPSLALSSVPSGGPTVLHSDAPSVEPSESLSSEPSSVSSSAPSVVHSMVPSSEPSQAPSLAPSEVPSGGPTMMHSDAPSIEPSGSPSSEPSSAPSGAPTVVHSMVPSSEPSQAPSLAPSSVPSSGPTVLHSDAPSIEPSGSPSSEPSSVSSSAPSVVHSTVPSSESSQAPSLAPSEVPSGGPTVLHSDAPSIEPSGSPSSEPSSAPSGAPTVVHSMVPSSEPSQAPSLAPNSVSSSGPTVLHSDAPSIEPSGKPSSEPSSVSSSAPSVVHSMVPSSEPSQAPSSAPSEVPSGGPTVLHSDAPSIEPSGSPSLEPSSAPSGAPTVVHSMVPSSEPSQAPSLAPSSVPSSGPTVLHSDAPSIEPSGSPSLEPSSVSSSAPSVVHSMIPSSEPSQAPSLAPSEVPSGGPTVLHSDAPSIEPSGSPSAEPSSAPSGAPTVVHSMVPSSEPSQAPSLAPSSVSSSGPTVLHSDAPSIEPSGKPSSEPSSVSSSAPSVVHSTVPSSEPSQAPSSAPSEVPSGGPTVLHSDAPSIEPSGSPSSEPSSAPSGAPTVVHSMVPSNEPSQAPSLAPSSVPSSGPTVLHSDAPSIEPSGKPSSVPSLVPSSAPTVVHSMVPSSEPSQAPSSAPSSVPSSGPTVLHSDAPSVEPSGSPSLDPSSMPSSAPTVVHSMVPSSEPSQAPSSAPSSVPSSGPTVLHSDAPSVEPSGSPSLEPSSMPSSAPSVVHSFVPSNEPSQAPSLAPSSVPSSGPTVLHSEAPSVEPSGKPSLEPSSVPSSAPSVMHSMVPSNEPSQAPSLAPSSVPSSGPTVLHSEAPSVEPSGKPSLEPSSVPSSAPSAVHSMVPSNEPSQAPSLAPTMISSDLPTVVHSDVPSMESLPSQVPSSVPSIIRSDSPSNQPSTAFEFWCPPSTDPTLPPLPNDSCYVSVVGLSEPGSFVKVKVDGQTFTLGNCDTFIARHPLTVEWHAYLGNFHSGKTVSPEWDCSPGTAWDILDVSSGFCSVEIVAPENARVAIKDVPHLQEMVNGDIAFLPINEDYKYKIESLGIIGSDKSFNTDSCPTQIVATNLNDNHFCELEVAINPEDQVEILNDVPSIIMNSGETLTTVYDKETDVVWRILGNEPNACVFSTKKCEYPLDATAACTDRHCYVTVSGLQEQDSYISIKDDISGLFNFDKLLVQHGTEVEWRTHLADFHSNYVKTGSWDCNITTLDVSSGFCQVAVVVPENSSIGIKDIPHLLAMESGDVFLPKMQSYDWIPEYLGKFNTDSCPQPITICHVSIAGLEEPGSSIEIKNVNSGLINNDGFLFVQGTEVEWSAQLGKYKSPFITSPPLDCNNPILDVSSGFCSVEIVAPENSRVKIKDAFYLNRMLNGDSALLPINEDYKYMVELLGVTGPEMAFDTKNSCPTQVVATTTGVEFCELKIKANSGEQVEILNDVPSIILNHNDKVTTVANKETLVVWRIVGNEMNSCVFSSLLCQSDLDAKIDCNDRYCYVSVSGLVEPGSSIEIKNGNSGLLNSDRFLVQHGAVARWKTHLANYNSPWFDTEPWNCDITTLDVSSGFCQVEMNLQDNINIGIKNIDHLQAIESGDVAFLPKGETYEWVPGFLKTFNTDSCPKIIGICYVSITGLEEPGSSIEIKDRISGLINDDTFLAVSDGQVQWSPQLATFKSAFITSAPLDCNNPILDVSLGFCPVEVVTPERTRVGIKDIPHLQAMRATEIAFLPIGKSYKWIPEALGVPSSEVAFNTNNCGTPTIDATASGEFCELPIIRNDPLEILNTNPSFILNQGDPLITVHDQTTKVKWRIEGTSNVTFCVFEVQKCNLILDATDDCSVRFCQATITGLEEEASFVSIENTEYNVLFNFDQFTVTDGDEVEWKAHLTDHASVKFVTDPWDCLEREILDVSVGFCAVEVVVPENGQVELLNVPHRADMVNGDIVLLPRGGDYSYNPVALGTLGSKVNFNTDDCILTSILATDEFCELNVNMDTNDTLQVYNEDPSLVLSYGETLTTVVSQRTDIIWSLVGSTDQCTFESDACSVILDTAVCIPIRRQLEEIQTGKNTASSSLLSYVLKSNFTGASGHVHFGGGEFSNSRNSIGVTIGIYNVQPSETNPATGNHSYISELLSLYNETDGWNLGPGTGVVFRDGAAMPWGTMRRIFRHNYLKTSSRVFGLFLMILTWIAALISSGMICWMWNDAVIHRAQPFFMQLMCFGSIIMASGIFTLSWDEGSGWTNKQLSIACSLTPWFFFSGNITIFCALAGKLWRLEHAIQLGLPFKTIFRAIWPLFLILISTVGILVAQTVYDPWAWERHVIHEIPAETYGMCQGHHYLAFMGPLMGLLFSSELIILYFAWRSSHFSDSGAAKAVMYTCLLRVQAWAVGFSLLACLGYASADATYLARASLIFGFAISGLIVVVYPEIYTAMKNKQNKDKCGMRRNRRGTVGAVFALQDDTLSDTSLGYLFSQKQKGKCAQPKNLAARPPTKSTVVPSNPHEKITNAVQKLQKKLDACQKAKHEFPIPARGSTPVVKPVGSSTSSADLSKQPAGTYTDYIHGEQTEL